MREVIVVTTLLLLTATASATVVRVDWSGGGDYPTIQGGINAAGEGDTVLVAAGTYSGEGNRALDFGGTNIVLRSESGRESTFIEADYAADGFTLTAGEDTTSVISGFTVQHADRAFRLTDASPRVEDCSVERSWRHAGTLTNSGAIFRDCYFHGEWGNGLPRDEGFTCFGPAAPTLTGCTFEGLVGYTMWTDGASVSMRDCEFYDCLGGDYGAVHCRNCSPVFQDILMADCYINSFEYVGDCLSFRDCSATVERATFIRCGDRHYGTVHCDGGTLSLHECVFWEDYSTPVICVWGGGHLDIENVTVASAVYGHAIGLPAATSDASATVTNSILAFGPGAPILNNGTGEVFTTHSCVFGNAGGDSLVGGHAENVFAAPLFCGLLDADLMLHDDSPCLPGNNPWAVLMGALGAGGCGTGLNGHETPANGLASARPSPFSTSTTVRFALASRGPVVVRLFDVAGRLVATLVDDELDAGPHEVLWDGTTNSGGRAASGVYFVRMEVDGTPATGASRKLVLLK